MTGTGDVGISRALAQKDVCFPPLDQSHTMPTLRSRDSVNAERRRESTKEKHNEHRNEHAVGIQ
eukprot:4905728-Pyramimonas_sp.AAC.2